jgi:hypothetical protein
MIARKVWVDQNKLQFYTWGSEDCCLPRGATTATLLDHKHLDDGDFLMFGEVLGPRTGNDADADRTKRHVVRLTKQPTQTRDELRGVDITEIEWSADDALPFPLCISASLTDKDGRHVFPDVSLAIGNMVPADHGRTVQELLPSVPKPTLFRPPAAGGDFCSPAAEVAVISRYLPMLSAGPITHRAPLDITSAAAMLRQPLDDVMPAIELQPPPTKWQVRPDLLESGPADTHFVAEVGNDGFAALRFGDDEYGQRPNEGTQLTATYRVGNGIAGNVGQNSLRHVVTAEKDNIVFVWNPLPAKGGIEPETVEHARQSAPAAFRLQERAVTERDFEEVTERRPDVSRAAATFRWTGTWHTLFDTIDRTGGAEVDEPFREDVRLYLDRFRMVGYDTNIDGPRFVPLELALTVCVKAGYFRTDVEAVLLDLFGSGTRRNGERGFFHPDNFTFGQPAALSRIIAAAMSVEGVDAVFVTRFRRQGMPRTDAVDTGLLKLARLEIALLDNSRDFPERGSLTLTMRGGA